jgi:Zn-dependent metalloprotease
MKTNVSAKLTAIFAAAVIIGGASRASAFRMPGGDPAITEDGVTRSYRDPSSVSGLEAVHIRTKQPLTGDANRAAIDIVDDLMRESGSRAVVRRVQVDRLGFKHVRLVQQYHGLPVVGGELIVHINNLNTIYKINGKYSPSINVSVEPSITPEAALQIGLDEQRGKPNISIGKQPSLVIYGPHLAYHYVISHQGVEAGQWWYYVDAHTGELLQRHNNIKYGGPTGNGSHQPVSGYRLTGEDGSWVTMTGWKETGGNYYLYNYDESWGVYNEDTYDWEQRTASDWGTSDRAAISLGKNFSLTQDWVTNLLGRNSFDDAGALARANVHTGINYVNAYWDGTDFHFGDGDGVIADELTTLDIAAHEYGHAITDYTSTLVYAYESGALNESYSDIMGVAVEFASQPDGTGSYPSGIPGYADWLLGEDAWLADDALRDMRDPQRFGQPSYYHGTYWYYGSGDYGGVHTNSGVQNFAFYLLAEGGTGTNDGHPYSITGIGVTAAAEIAMRANTVYLTPTSQYADSRQAWIDAAADLGYPTATVEDVWTAVGVLPAGIINKLRPPADTTVAPGEVLGPFFTKVTNTSDSYIQFYVQPYLIKPNGSIIWFSQKFTGLAAGETRRHRHGLPVPPWAPEGNFTWGVKLTDTGGDQLDDDSFDFTVTTGTPADSSTAGGSYTETDEADDWQFMTIK